VGGGILKWGGNVAVKVEEMGREKKT